MTPDIYPAPTISPQTQMAFHLLAKLFFDHNDRLMRLMAELLRRGRYADEIMNLLAMEEMQRIKQQIAHAQPNDPCPCSSGKKFLKCHGRK